MKTQHISGGIIALLFLALIPQASEAYFTTGQSATKISDNAAIFAIEYAFGLEDHDIYMPIFAERDLARESDEEKVGYSIRDDEEKTESGVTAGLVLSSAPIVDGMYKIAKDTAHKMTLFIILVTDKNANESDYALQVEKLPYYVDKGGEDREALQLNESELQYYVTKEVELNTGNLSN